MAHINMSTVNGLDIVEAVANQWASFWSENLI